MTAIAAEMDTADLTLERAQRGDHDAFAKLVRQHESMVFSVGYHFFNSADKASEVAQDVFLQLYRSLQDITDPVHLTNWLRRVASRRCIDALRRSRFRMVSLDDAGDLPVAARTTDPFLARRMSEHIAALPEAQRMLVILRYQEELGPNDISEIVGMPVNTVKSQLHRALRVLRKKLETR